MLKKLKQLRWQNYLDKSQKLCLAGLRHKQIQFYDEELLALLREVHFCGFPAAVLLLSHQFCNTRCHECAYLMAKAFFNTDSVVRVVDAVVASLQLNPKNQVPIGTHSFVERLLPDGRTLIYDTTDGLVYDQACYWQIEHPKIVKVYEKAELQQYGAAYEALLFKQQPQLPQIAQACIQKSLQDQDHEIYNQPGYQLLAQELATFNAQMREKS